MKLLRSFLSVIAVAGSLFTILFAEQASAAWIIYGLNNGATTAAREEAAVDSVARREEASQDSVAVDSVARREEASQDSIAQKGGAPDMPLPDMPLVEIETVDDPTQIPGIRIIEPGDEPIVVNSGEEAFLADGTHTPRDAYIVRPGGHLFLGQKAIVVPQEGAIIEIGKLGRELAQIIGPVKKYRSEPLVFLEGTHNALIQNAVLSGNGSGVVIDIDPEQSHDITVVADHVYYPNNFTALAIETNGRPTDTLGDTRQIRVELRYNIAWGSSETDLGIVLDSATNLVLNATNSSFLSMDAEDGPLYFDYRTIAGYMIRIRLVDTIIPEGMTWNDSHRRINVIRSAYEHTNDGTLLVQQTEEDGSVTQIWPIAPPNPADFNKDGVVDFDDFFLFADNFGKTQSDIGIELFTILDIDGSGGALDFDDLFMFADNFGARSAKMLSMASKMLGLPDRFSLAQNYPNPFNPETTISFKLPRDASVTLAIYDAIGQEVARLVEKQRMAAGRHAVKWDGRISNGQMAASGVYFYRIQADRYVQTRKMTLLR